MRLAAVPIAFASCSTRLSEADSGTEIALLPMVGATRPQDKPGSGSQSGAKPKPTARPAKPALDYAAHIARLRKRLPRPEQFHIVIEKPFVVVGDESKRMVERRSKQTVKWAVDLLKKAYFPEDPDHIIDVWLFKDKKSYQKHTRQILKQVPTTPFGYYSPAKRALIMNIATGGGTLVHEIVHPFMAANFPNCPSWFNEGMGSLYEQCSEKGKKIMGLTNWRLDGLQKSIKAEEVPSFKTLCSTTDHEFYSEDPGTNYSQARYLCYYLQEKGLLRKYYKAFHAGRKKDPSGFATLKKILGRDGKDGRTMAAFKKEWQAYVMKLRFR